MAEGALVAVNVATFDGESERFDCKPEDTVLDVKKQIAARRCVATARLKLLAGTRILPNQQSVGDLAPVDASGGAVQLQLLREIRRPPPANVQVLAASGAAGAWDVVIDLLLTQLKDAGVQQGQVLWIDLHNKGGSTESVASAHYSLDLVGRGPLDVGYVLHRAATWEELDAAVAQAAAAKDVISISGSSCSGGLVMATFYHAGETMPVGEVEHVSSSAGSWHGAMWQLLVKLHAQRVQRGQLLGIDAHNLNPDAPAQFSAHFCRSLPGTGELFLDFRSMNASRDWAAFHQHGCKEAAGRDIVSSTCSSNCDGRSVGYTIYAVAEPLGFVEATAAPGDWEAAVQQLSERLAERGVERGQLLRVDAHNVGPRGPAVLCAYHDAARPGRGPLELRAAVRRGRSLAELDRWAAEAATEAVAGGRRVLSATAASSGADGEVAALLVSEAGRADAPAFTVEHASAAAGSWNGAADALLQRLAALGLQRGQVLSIDAHNEGPRAQAVFSAHFSKGLAGLGPLDLKYQSINLSASWAFFHKQAAVMGAEKSVLSITGSSNENGRSVMYVFSCGG